MTEEATFAMGCFWGVEALFGSVEGVKRTKVGYTGGDKDDPTYRSLGNHTETVRLEFDPEKVGYEDLLELFWSNHDYTAEQKPQYASRIFYHGDEQKREAEDSKPENAVTDIFTG